MPTSNVLTIAQLDDEQEIRNESNNAPFRIVRRVLEEARKHAARDSVTANNQDAMLVRVHASFVEDLKPNGLHQLCLAEPQYVPRGSFAVFLLVCIL